MKELSSVASDDLELIKVSLEGVPGIIYAFIYCSPEERTKAESDINVMVIGGPDLEEMEDAISKAEERLGKEVHITSFTLSEFRERMKRAGDFARAVIDGPKRMLIGSEKEMKQI